MNVRGDLARALVAVVLLAGCSSRTPAEGLPADNSPSPSAAGHVTIPPVPPNEEQGRLNAQLIAAAWKDDVITAGRLIQAGADVNYKDSTVQSAFLIATSEGHLDLLDLALRSGALVNDKDSFNGTGLIRAADRGHAAIAGRLVRAGIDLDHVNRLGWTALHEAIILGDGSQRYADTVRVLVAAGVDVTLRSRQDGISPLQHAGSRGYDVIVRTLRAAIEGERPRDPDAALLAAAAEGDADRVALALRAGGKIDARDARRRTALLLAASVDSLPAARVLVYLRADPDALDDRHDTPWLITGETGSVRMAELLLTARPDLRLRNRFGGTAIIPASERGHVEYVRRVARTGIDLDHVNDLGWTALLEAVILGQGGPAQEEIVRILLDAGAAPNLADRNGVTALQHARAKGYGRIAAVLERSPDWAALPRATPPPVRYVLARCLEKDPSTVD